MTFAAPDAEAQLPCQRYTLAEVVLLNFGHSHYPAPAFAAGRCAANCRGLPVFPEFVRVGMLQADDPTGAVQRTVKVGSPPQHASISYALVSAWKL